MSDIPCSSVKICLLNINKRNISLVSLSLFTFHLVSKVAVTAQNNYFIIFFCSNICIYIYIYIYIHVFFLNLERDKSHKIVIVPIDFPITLLCNHNTLH